MLSIRVNGRVKLWRNSKITKRATKAKPYVDKYNWEGINNLVQKGDRKKFEKDIWSIALNVLDAKKEKDVPF